MNAARGSNVGTVATSGTSDHPAQAAAIPAHASTIDRISPAFLSQLLTTARLS
ncbi:hypothetical protein P7K49_005498, partial [Saguinus oedipus]